MKIKLFKELSIGDRIKLADTEEHKDAVLIVVSDLGKSDFVEDWLWIAVCYCKGSYAKISTLQASENSTVKIYNL